MNEDGPVHVLVHLGQPASLRCDYDVDPALVTSMKVAWSRKDGNDLGEKIEEDGAFINFDKVEKVRKFIQYM